MSKRQQQKEKLKRLQHYMEQKRQWNLEHPEEAAKKKEQHLKERLEREKKRLKQRKNRRKREERRRERQKKRKPLVVTWFGKDFHLTISPRKAKMFRKKKEEKKNGKDD
jgi:hypothetical protein